MSYKIQKLEKTDWPPLLGQINDPPKQLFYAGEIPNYENKFLCMVGSRKYTNYGREVVSSIISDLRGFPITIVSGLALGIDAIVHRAAIANKLSAIAVPGSGLDPHAMHPKTNLQLAEEIISSGGTLISEFNPDFKATLWSFPMRNRIMAGMCHATLIVEAEQKSGTMITAKLTTEYNRELLAIPGSILSPMSEGPNMFIRLGATLIRSADDVLEALGIGKFDFLNMSSDSTPNSLDGAHQGKYADCSEREMIIIKILSEPLSRDEILRQANLEHQIPIGEAQTLLSLLELKSLIKESLGEIRLT